jgi:uncharacterized protein YdhG (YjbR/CyaY superfamily)
MTQKTSSQAVSAFLAALPDDRRREVERVRALVRKHLPKGYEEVISNNMLVYQVPLDRYPDTYNGRPLWYVALGSQKNYLALHLMRVYADAEQQQQLTNAFKAAAKKLDMGKACIRFKSADDLPSDAIADIVASTPVDRWVEIAESARRR